jgi:membrane-associated phospholipid phosphatase
MLRGPTLLALWLLLLAGFAVLSGFAAAADHFPADVWLAHHLQEIHSAAFDDAVSLPETLADLPFVLAVWLPALGLLWLLRRRWEALILLLAPLGSGINSVVKSLVDRPRPSPDLVRVTESASGASFPSGHTVAAVLVFGLLLYFATVLVRSAWLRLPLQIACLYGIAFTGIARVYHGAHWPSDVLGGYYLGGLMLLALITAHRWRPLLRKGE